jgi:hypothetical protein
MKSTFIVNGKTQLVLTPETDTEKVLLAALLKQSDRMITDLSEDSAYARTYGHGSLLITSQAKLHADEEETV